MPINGCCERYGTNDGRQKSDVGRHRRFESYMLYEGPGAQPTMRAGTAIHGHRRSVVRRYEAYERKVNGNYPMVACVRVLERVCRFDQATVGKSTSQLANRRPCGQVIDAENGSWHDDARS